MVDYLVLQEVPQGELSELAAILDTNWSDQRPLTERRRKLMIELAISGRYFGKDETLGGKRRPYTCSEFEDRRNRILQLP